MKFKFLIIPLIIFSLTSCSSSPYSYGDLIRTDYDEFLENYEKGLKKDKNYKYYEINIIDECRYKEKNSNGNLIYEIENYFRNELTITIYDTTYLGALDHSNCFIAFSQKQIERNIYGINKTAESTRIIEYSADNSSYYESNLRSIKSGLEYPGTSLIESIFVSSSNYSIYNTIGRTLYNIYQNDEGDVAFRGLVDVTDNFDLLPSGIKLEPVIYVIQFNKFGQILFEGLEKPYSTDITYSSSNEVKNIHLEFNQTMTTFYNTSVEKPENGIIVDGENFVIPELSTQK